ncbi:hypothetical protein BC940DRAFT_281129 [Gongronella butleri]|nr:hypothetical protein BC940DRAFT_281129 [Gongronella butleri]
MKFSLALLSIGALASAVVAAPAHKKEHKKAHKHSHKRATQYCGQWDQATEGNYILYANLWGASSATSGWQCMVDNGLSGNTLSWSTSWNWQGGYASVKSYTNAALKFSPVQLSAIKSIPVSWSWKYSGSNIIADVSIDAFTSSSPGGNNEYEIMIWPAALGGAGPISSTGSPIASFDFGGTSWKLYKGPNGSTTVYSFVASSVVNNLSGDINAFFKYLVSNNYIGSSQYLNVFEAGTEPFSGNDAVFTVSGYSASIST